MAVVGAMVLGACGGDDDDDAGNGSDSGGDSKSAAYVEATAAAIGEGGEGLPLDETQATCVATALVDVAGADALDEAEITPQQFAAAGDYSSLDVELPSDAADSLGADLADCDIADPFRDLLLGTFVDQFGTELPEDGSDCLNDDLDDDAMVGALAETFIDGKGDHLQDLLVSSVAACPPVVTAVLLAQAPTEPTPEVEACVTDFVEANADAVNEAFTSGEGPAAQELGTQLAGACPEAFAGADTGAAATTTTAAG
jgi:hypothetical protein